MTRPAASRASSLTTADAAWQYWLRPQKASGKTLCDGVASKQRAQIVVSCGIAAANYSTDAGIGWHQPRGVALSAHQVLAILPAILFDNWDHGTRNPLADSGSRPTAPQVPTWKEAKCQGAKLIACFLDHRGCLHLGDDNRALGPSLSSCTSCYLRVNHRGQRGGRGRSHALFLSLCPSPWT